MGPYCYTATWEFEKVNPSEGKFTSNEIKYFNVRVNPDGVTESGINGNDYDVVSRWYNQLLDSDTIIRFSQYDSEGNLLKVTNISLGDKTVTS